MIELSEIRKTYQLGGQTVKAVDGLSLTILPGEFVAIMGPSGSGKSTLMHILGLLDLPDSGSYRLNGMEVSKLTEDELADRRRQALGFVFQQFYLLPRTSALENVALPHLYSRSRPNFDTARELLTKVGLGSRLHHEPNQLSGGQQQRVAIARALVNHAGILLADEPTGNLDSTSEKEIIEILRQLNADGMTVIVVTHEESVALQTRRIVRMRDGLIQSDERVGELQSLPAKPSTASWPGGRDDWQDDFWQKTLGFFRAGVRALTANMGRTVLSTLGILIGVGAVVAMIAVGRGAREQVKEQMARLGSNRLQLNPGANRVNGVMLDPVTRLTLTDGDAIWNQFPEVRRIAPEIDGRVQVTYANKNWATRIRGTTADFAPMHDLVPTEGRFFTDQENAERKRVAVIGVTLVRHLFGDKNPLGDYVRINKILFQIVGILPEKGFSGPNDRDDIIMIPVITAMRRVLGKTYVDEFNLEVEDPEQIEPMKGKLVDLMVARHHSALSQKDPFDVRDLSEIQKAMMESSDTMSLMIICVAGISLLVGGVGIMNIMLVTVAERTPEIGLRKAVGANRSDILMQFLTEAVVVTLVGGVTGILFGWTICLGLAFFFSWSTVFSLDAVALALFSSIMIGITFGIWPAIRASRLSPIKALRAE